jgi:hypothetical protein
MQGLGAAGVAILIFYLTDQFVCDGRYFGVVIEAVRQAALTIEIHA